MLYLEADVEDIPPCLHLGRLRQREQQRIVGTEIPLGINDGRLSVALMHGRLGVNQIRIAKGLQPLKGILPTGRRGIDAGQQRGIRVRKGHVDIVAAGAADDVASGLKTEIAPGRREVDERITDDDIALQGRDPQAGGIDRQGFLGHAGEPQLIIGRTQTVEGIDQLAGIVVQRHVAGESRQSDAAFAGVGEEIIPAAGVIDDGRVDGRRQLDIVAGLQVEAGIAQRQDRRQFVFSRPGLDGTAGIDVGRAATRVENATQHVATGPNRKVAAAIDFDDVGLEIRISGIIRLGDFAHLLACGRNHRREIQYVAAGFHGHVATAQRAQVLIERGLRPRRADRTANRHRPGRRNLTGMVLPLAPGASTGHPAIEELAGLRAHDVTPRLDTDIAALDGIFAKEIVGHEGVLEAAVTVRGIRAAGGIDRRAGAAQHQILTGVDLDVTGAGADKGIVGHPDIIPRIETETPGFTGLQHVPDRHAGAWPRDCRDVDAIRFVPEAIRELAIDVQCVRRRERQHAGATAVTPIDQIPAGVAQGQIALTADIETGQESSLEAQTSLDAVHVGHEGIGFAFPGRDIAGRDGAGFLIDLDGLQGGSGRPGHGAGNVAFEGHVLTAAIRPEGDFPGRLAVLILDLELRAGLQHDAAIAVAIGIDRGNGQSAFMSGGTLRGDLAARPEPKGIRRGQFDRRIGASRRDGAIDAQRAAFGDQSHQAGLQTLTGI